MSVFEQILTASAEELLKLVFKSAAARDGQAQGSRSREIAHKLGLTHAQLLCAAGFNAHIRELPDVATILGFPGYDALARARDEYFTHDVYKRLGIKDVLAIYAQVARDTQHQQVMQYLMSTRLKHIEDKIEATVDSLVIERYKKEMRGIYSDGVALPEFVEWRLANTHSGFRALLNEVLLIVEHRLVPVGDIFFRDAVLPEEKRRLITKGLVPRDLIAARLAEPDIPVPERKVLEEQLRLS